MTYYQNKKDFFTRKEEADRIMDKYPNRIPIIVHKDKRCKDIPDIDRTKYLVPDDLTVGQFLYVLRRRIKLSHEKSIYLFFNSNIACTSSLLSQIYIDQKNKDGFLYCTYTGESTFG
jgi:GABA(A) receptor-associated protein